jgi:hypothetical protein
MGGAMPGPGIAGSDNPAVAGGSVMVGRPALAGELAWVAGPGAVAAPD